MMRGVWKKIIVGVFGGLLIAGSVLGMGGCRCGVAEDFFDFHTELQQKYLSDNYNSVGKYAHGNEELSAPYAAVLKFDEVADAPSYVLEYAGRADFLNAVVVRDLTKKKFEIHNLELGQEIFWRGAIDEGGLSDSFVHRLVTCAQAPRNVLIDGVSNARDIGGYPSSLSRRGRIRQGLLFRAGNPVEITETGKQELLRLGVRCELDLRDEYQCQGPYIDGIEYNAIPIPSQTEAIRFEEFAVEYKEIYSHIANADKKPVYLHCHAGADRTGFCSFMLLVVCGVSYADAARDYLFTNFSMHGERNLNSEFNRWWLKLNRFKGLTKAEKAKNWFISKGITAEQVDKIRKIFVDGL